MFRRDLSRHPPSAHTGPIVGLLNLMEATSKEGFWPEGDCEIAGIAAIEKAADRIRSVVRPIRILFVLGKKPLH
jgi:hypothetical protein